MHPECSGVLYINTLCVCLCTTDHVIITWLTWLSCDLTQVPHKAVHPSPQETRHLPLSITLWTPAQAATTAPLLAMASQWLAVSPTTDQDLTHRRTAMEVADQSGQILAEEWWDKDCKTAILGRTPMEKVSYCLSTSKQTCYMCMCMYI